MKMVTKYIADDGVVFDTKESCEYYEKGKAELVEFKFKNISGMCSARYYDSDFSMFGGEDVLYAVDIRNKDDLKAVNDWLEFHLTERNCPIDSLSTDTIGTIQIFSFDLSEGYFCKWGTPDEFKEAYSSVIDAFIYPIMHEAQK